VKARRYTGTKDGVAKGRRAGMTAWIDNVIELGGGALWNNGDFVVRNMRGKESLSVHATGRAVDISYRFMRNIGKGSSTRGIEQGGRQVAINVMRTLVRNADLIGLELILDYFPQPHGRGWRCDRRAWIRYDVRTIAGAPNGDWFHCEVMPMFADDPDLVNAAFATLRQIP